MVQYIGYNDVSVFGYAGIAQSVEQLIRNQQVAGSSPVTSSSSPQEETLAASFFIYGEQEGVIHDI